MADPVDLPSNVAAALQQNAVASASQVASDSRANASLSMQALGAGIVATQNLLGTTTAARAVSGINATPLASPTDQQAK